MSVAQLFDSDLDLVGGLLVAGAVAAGIVGVYLFSTFRRAREHAREERREPAPPSAGDRRPVFFKRYTPE